MFSYSHEMSFNNPTTNFISHWGIVESAVIMFETTATFWQGLPLDLLSFYYISLQSNLR